MNKFHYPLFCWTLFVIAIYLCFDGEQHTASNIDGRGCPSLYWHWVSEKISRSRYWYRKHGTWTIVGTGTGIMIVKSNWVLVPESMFLRRLIHIINTRSLLAASFPLFNLLLIYSIKKRNICDICGALEIVFWSEVFSEELQGSRVRTLLRCSPSMPAHCLNCNINSK